MPLLRRQPFRREPMPANLRPNEELFYCKLTKEVFRDYDAFFERVILCNSLVWTCELTGRPGLTYVEAVEWETRARNSLKAMPNSMRKPLLYLAYISRCGRLSDLCDDVFLFAKDRFFVGEEVDALINGERVPCKIVKVVPPGTSKRKQSFTKLMVNDNSEDEESAENASRANCDPSKCQYMVLDCQSTDREIHLLSPEDILRKKGVFSKEKSKLFLKQTCHLSGCHWVVKDKFVEKYGVDRMKFKDIFAGSRPTIESEPSRKKGVVPLPSQKVAIAASAAGKTSKSGSGSGKKVDGGKSSTAGQKSASSSSSNGKGGFKNSGGGSNNSSKKISSKVQRQIEADMEATRLAEAMALAEEKRRLKEDLRLKVEEDRRRRKEEQAKEREQLREDRRIMAECLKEWQKPRDDLECDDLLDMPTPVPVECGIPNHLFGEAAMLLEFVHSFGDTLETKDRFPQGLSLELLERALVEQDVAGPLNDLLQMFMRAVFRFQEEDDDDDGSGAGATSAGCSDGAVSAPHGDDLDLKRALRVAAAASNWPTYCHGSPLSKLELDAFTLTEVLRLHLLSSGARKNPEDPTSQDDAGLCLWLHEPELIRSLARSNVFDLPASDKLKILRALADQLLGFYTLREEIDENLDKARAVRADLKSMQWAEQRREREEASLRFKRKMEERASIKAETESQNASASAASTPTASSSDKKETTVAAAAATTTKKDNVDKKPVAKKPLTPEELKREEEKQADREARKKQDFVRKEKELLESLARLQGRGALLPLGRDRAYRRFWMFGTLPGLFVEDNDCELGPCPAEPTPYNPNSNPYASFNSSMSQARLATSTVSDKENNAAAPPNAPAVTAALVAVNKKNHHKLLSDNHPTASVLNGVIDGAKIKSESTTNDGATDGHIKSETEAMAVDEDAAPDVVKPVVFGMCNALGDSCPVHGVKPGGARWYFYPSSGQVEALIAALNPRGYREGSLKEILVADKRRVLQSVGRCPVSRLNPAVNVEKSGTGEDGASSASGVAVNEGVRKSNRISQVANAVYPPGTTMENFLELTLRDSIVDMEDKIHAGGLGSIKVFDRAAWREAIVQQAYDRQCDNLRWGVKLENRKLVLGGNATSENGGAPLSNPKPCRVGSPVPTKTVVTDLASALLQIFQGIELKYLTPPLAGDKDGPSHKSASERWEEALMSCTSLSQVFLFFTTLEKSVAWSRSALNARCRICRRRGDAEHMLLCDECDRGHHMYCLKPRLKNVPEGDWLCPDCKPVEKPKKSRKRRLTQEEDEEEEELDVPVDVEVDDCPAPTQESAPKRKREESRKESSKRDSAKREAPSRRERETASSAPPAKRETAVAPPKRESTAPSTKREATAPSSKRETSAPPTKQDVPCAQCKKDGELVVCCGCQLGYHSECADPPIRRSSRGRWRCRKCGGTNAATTPLLNDGSEVAAAATSAKSTAGSRTEVIDRHSRSSRQAASTDRTRQNVALKSKGTANDDVRRSARNAGRDTDYKKHSKYESDEDWETSTPRRSSRRPREDLSDDEYYGMTKRQTPPNRRGASDDVPLDYKICDQLLFEMVRHDDSWPFLRPVGKKELPLYHRVIKCPMDFGTMRSKLNTMTYTDNKQFVNDVFLVFQNCCIFNPAHTMQYKAAETLSRLFHRRLREVGLPLLTEEERHELSLRPATSKAAARRRVLVIDSDDNDSGKFEGSDNDEDNDDDDDDEDEQSWDSDDGPKATDVTPIDSDIDEAERAKIVTESVQSDSDEMEEELAEEETSEEGTGEDCDDVIVELEGDGESDEDGDNERGNGGGRLVIDCNGYDDDEDERHSDSSTSNADH